MAGLSRLAIRRLLAVLGLTCFAGLTALAGRTRLAIAGLLALLIRLTRLALLAGLLLTRFPLLTLLARLSRLGTGLRGARLRQGRGQDGDRWNLRRAGKLREALEIGPGSFELVGQIGELLASWRAGCGGRRGHALRHLVKAVAGRLCSCRVARLIA